MTYRYRLRAYDSGSAGWVTWTSDQEPPNISPAAADTTPNYSGSLTIKHITSKEVRLVGYQDVLDANFATMGNQSISTNGVHAIDGKNWTKENSASDATALAIVNGSGLEFKPVASSGLYPPGPTRTGVILRIDPTQLYSAFEFTTGLRIWCYFTLNNAANYDHLKVVVETATASTNISFQVMRLWNTADNWGFNSYYNGGALSNAYTTTDLSDTVMVLDMPSGVLADDWRISTGVYGSGWPAAEALRTQYRGPAMGSRDTTIQVTEPSAVNILLECGRDGSGTSLTGVVKRLRVQMLI